MELDKKEAKLKSKAPASNKSKRHSTAASTKAKAGTSEESTAPPNLLMSLSPQLPCRGGFPPAHLHAPHITCILYLHLHGKSLYFYVAY
jgi:hypothetical protein